MVFGDDSSVSRSKYPFKYVIFCSYIVKYEYMKYECAWKYIWNIFTSHSRRCILESARLEEKPQYPKAILNKLCVNLNLKILSRICRRSWIWSWIGANMRPLAQHKSQSTSCISQVTYHKSHSTSHIAQVT